MRAVPLNRYWVFLLIVAAGVAVDLATKRWVFNWLGMPGGGTFWLRPDVLGLQTSLNEGALFGLGQGMSWLFVGLSIAAAVAVCWYLFVAGAARQWLLTVALSAMTAGILGNLYDRLGLPGLRWNFANSLHNAGEPVYAVRDWILVMLGSYHWPNFNVADSLLVCGTAALAWHALFQKQPGSRGATA